MRKWIVLGAGAAFVALVVILIVVRAGQKKAQAEKFAAAADVSAAVEVVTPRVGAIEDTQVFLGKVVSTDEITVFSKIPGKVVSLPAKIGAKVAPGSTLAVVDYDQPGMKFRYHDAYSPIAGEVSAVLVSVGDMVDPSRPIAVVVKPGSVKIEVNVPADALAALYKGMEVKVCARGCEEAVVATVTNLPTSLSTETHLAAVEIRPKDKATGLRAGMFAEVEVPLARHDNAVIVPPNAVKREREGAAVYVVAGDHMQRRLVKVGITREDAVEVTAGLKGDEEVIVVGSRDLRDKLKISKKSPHQP